MLHGDLIKLPLRLGIGCVDESQHEVLDRSRAGQDWGWGQGVSYIFEDRKVEEAARALCLQGPVEVTARRQAARTLA